MHTHTHRTKGAIELVDASEMVPALVRRPGWKTWKVLDEDLHQWLVTAAHCNTLQHTATHCNTLQQDLKGA